VRAHIVPCMNGAMFWWTWMLSASMWATWMLSESTYSALHEWGHVLVDLDAKCIYVGRVDAK
jgi:hypothetical protein